MAAIHQPDCIQNIQRGEELNLKNYTNYCKMCGLACDVVQSLSLVMAQMSNSNMCINQSQEVFVAPVR